jgi:hypothetical protein
VPFRTNWFSSTGSVSVTVNDGDTLVVFAEYSGTFYGISGGGNTYTQIGTALALAGAGTNVAAWVVAGAAAGSYNVAVSTDGSVPNLYVEAYSGLQPTLGALVRGTTSANGNSTTYNSGAILAQVGDTVVAGGCFMATSTLPSGWTSRDTNGGNLVAEIVLESFGSGSFTEAQSFSAGWAVFAVALVPMTGMSISPEIVGTASGGGPVTTSPGTTFAGDTLVVATSFESASGLSVSDSKANSWTAIGEPLINADGGRIQLWRCENVPNFGANHTVTVGSDSFNGVVWLIRLSCSNGHPTLDVATEGTDSSTPFSVATGVTAIANELVLALVANNGGSNPTTYASSNATILGQESNWASYWTAAVATMTAPTTSGAAPSFTMTNGGSTAAIKVAAFKSSALVVVESDYFNRADAATLGGNWSSLGGSLEVISGMAVPTTYGDSAVIRASAQLDLSAFWAQIAVGQIDGAGRNFGVGAASGAFNGYFGWWISASSRWYIERVDSGVATDLVYAAGTLSSGDVMRLERQGGSALRLYVNDVLVVQTSDTTYPSGSAYGAIVASISAPDRVRLDNYAAGRFQNITYRMVGTLTTEKSGGGLSVSGSVYPTGSLSKSRTASFAGSVTSSGALAKRLSKALAGDLTSIVGLLSRRAVKSISGSITSIAGSVSRSAAKTFSGSSSSSGVLIRSTSKPTFGSITPVASLTQVKTKLLSLTGSLGSTGTFASSVRKSLIGSLTPVGIVSRRVSALYSGSIATLVGSLSQIKTKAQNLTGSVAPTGSASYRTSKNFLGTLAPVGTLVKAVSKPVYGAVTTVIGSLAQTKTKLASFSGSITPTGALSSRFGKSFSGVVSSITGVVTGIKAGRQSLTGAITPSGSVTKSSSHTFAGSITSIVGSLTQIKTKLQALTGSITPSGSATYRTSKVLTGSMAPSGSLTKLLTRAFAGSIASSGALARGLSKLQSVSGGIAPTGTFSRSVTKALTGSLGSSGSIVKSVRRALAGTVASVGSYTGSKTVFKALTGSITSSGTLVKRVMKDLIGSIASVGVVVKRTSARFAGLVASTGLMSIGQSLRLFGSIVPVGSFSGSWLGILPSFVRALFTKSQGASCVVTSAGPCVTIESRIPAAVVESTSSYVGITSRGPGIEIVPLDEE